MEYFNQDYPQNICFVNSGLEIVKTIELEKKNKNFSLEGLSGIDYNKISDELFLVSDSSEGYLIKINSFSKIINLSQNKITLQKENFVNFRYSILNKFFKRGDGEGLRVIGKSIFVLNENDKKSRKPFSLFYHPNTLLEYDITNGKKVNSLNLPKSLEEGTSGLESLAISKNGLFLITTEGNISKNKNRKKYGKFFNLFPRIYKFKAEDELKPYTNARYLTINKNREISKISTFFIGGKGKIRDSYISKERDILLVLIQNHSDFNVILGFGLDVNKDKILIKDKIFEWKIPLNEKWEGITLGPILKNGLQSLLLVNDNDFHAPYNKGLKKVTNKISIFSIKLNNKCFNKNFIL